MPEALSITDIDRQHLELLPARTVMSILMTDKGTGGASSTTSTTDDTSSSSSGGTGDLFKDILGFVSKMAPLPK